MMIESSSKPALKPFSDTPSLKQRIHWSCLISSSFSVLNTALGLKKKRLMLGFGEESPQSSARSSNTTLVPSKSSATSISRKPTLLKGSAPRGPLSYKLLTRTDCDHERREIATYDGKPVFVEWISVECGVESKLKHRIKTLAALLQEVDLTTFHSLSCLGYLKDLTTGEMWLSFPTTGGTFTNASFQNFGPVINSRDIGTKSEQSHRTCHFTGRDPYCSSTPQAGSTKVYGQTMCSSSHKIRSR